MTEKTRVRNIEVLWCDRISCTYFYKEKGVQEYLCNVVYRDDSGELVGGPVFHIPRTSKFHYVEVQCYQPQRVQW